MIKNIVVIILALGFIAIVVFFDAPQVQAILSYRKQIEVQKQIFSDNQALLDKVEGLIDTYKQNKDNIEKINDILPTKEDIPNLIVQMEALVFEQGLILDKLEVASPTKEATTSKAEEVRTGKETAAPQKYKTLNINLGFTGDYSALKNFLTATEENMRLIDVDSINITPETEASGIFKFDLTLKTYYQ